MQLIETPHLNLDYSFQGLSDEQIQQYAQQRLPQNFDQLKQQLIKGEFKNPSEERTVTHTLCRSVHSVIRAGNGKNRFTEIVRTLRSGKWLGATGKAITDVVNIGVGGSDLGPMMGSFALKEFADDASLHNLQVHFVSSMDGGQLYAVLPIVDPETTLFIIASKSFGTPDTLANVDTVIEWASLALSHQQWLEHHVIGVSSNNQAMADFGIPARNQLSFADSVGGRYSLWSAIGLPIALTVGSHQFGRMLDGAQQMDEHFLKQPLLQNIPLLMAIIGLYNREQRNINNVAILPYDGRLRNLPNYLQQLDMESNGKQATHDNKAIDTPTAPIIWGGFGPNGQHAFFQHLHQGYDAFTADFIAILHRDAPGFDFAVQKSLREQQRLAVANCLAHRRLMWFGNINDQPPAAEKSACPLTEALTEPRNRYPGQKPSNLIYLDELNPASFGALLAAYEHKVFTQGLVWGLNSFDQPGVELGKRIAADIHEAIDHIDIDGTPSKQFDPSTDHIIKRM